MTDKIEWNIGDIVRLRSGGPLMTISRIITTLRIENIEVECIWFDDNKLYKEKFVFPTLLKDGEKKKNATK